MHALLDESLGGRGRILLLSGEAGIGKSRLLEETESLAGERGLPVVWGRAVEAEGAPAYWPWQQVIKGLENGTGQEMNRARAEWLTSASRLLSGDADANDAASRSGQGFPAAQDRFHVFEAVAHLLGATAAANGLVVLLDDLHWADLPSLRLLEHVAQTWPGTRALLVAAHRPAPAARDDPLRQTVAQLSRNDATVRLQLAGLGDKAAAEHLARLSGRELDGATVSELRRRTNGNPFFLKEFGQLIASRDNVSVSSRDAVGEVPPSVADVIAARVSRLSSECQEALEAASVIGHEPSADLVAAALSVAPADVLRRFDEAVAAGLLEAGPGAAYQFSHALVRDALYAELPSGRRIRLHELVAEELERRAHAGFEQLTSQLAYHWLQAVPAGHGEHAAQVAEQAAEQAMRQLAYEEAARLSEAAARAAPERSGRLLLGAARARFLGGELEQAATLCRAIAHGARSARDAALLADAALVITGVGDLPISTMICELCEDAIAVAPPDAVATRSRLLAQLTVAKLYIGDYDAMDGLSRQALDGAERAGDHDTLVAALRARHIASSHPSGVEQRLEVADRLLELAREPADELWARLWRFDVHIQLGDLNAAQAEVRSLAGIVERMQQPLARWHLANCEFVIAHARGDFMAARSAIDDAAAVGRSAGQLAHMRSIIQTMNISWLSGDDCSAALHAMTAVVQSSSPQTTWHLLGQLWPAVIAISQSRVEDARAIYDAMPAPATWRLMPPVFLVALSFRSVVINALGRREESRSIYRELLPFADQFSTSGAGTMACFGSVELYLGLLAATAGQHHTAVQHLERAVQRNGSAGMRPWALESRYQLAAALHRRGRSGDAGRALQLVVECEEAGARLKMRSLLARAGELHAALHAGTRQARVLTPREEEIARLVAEGLTSREIADTMHISARTADNHVQHILEKLGLRSRSQIAAWSARRTPDRGVDPAT